MSAPAATSARTSAGRRRRPGRRRPRPARWSATSTPVTPGTDRAAATSASAGRPASPTSTPSPAERAAQPGRRVDPQQAAAHERDPVAQPVRLVEVVGGEDDRPALSAHRLDRLADDVGRLGVERGRRLVEEDDRRLVEQRPGDRELLLHPLAERAGHVVPPLPQREEPQVSLDPRGARRRRRGRTAARRTRGWPSPYSLSYSPGVSVRMPTRARTAFGLARRRRARRPRRVPRSGR